MFWKKKGFIIEEYDLTEKDTPIEDTLTECNSCWCLLHKSKLHTKKYYGVHGFIDNVPFCNKCNPAWDTKYTAGCYGYKKTTYTKNDVECDENGKIKK